MWQRIGLYFFDRTLKTLIIWFVLVIFGIVSYTIFLKREGFPSVEVPLGVVQIVTIQDSPEAVDEAFVRPIMEEARKNDSLSSISSSASNQGATIRLTYNESTDVQQQLDVLKERVQPIVPAEGRLLFIRINASKLTAEGDDVLLSVHKQGARAEELDDLAAQLVPVLEGSLTLAERIQVYPLVQAVGRTSESPSQTVQTRYDRYYTRDVDGVLPSVAIGIKGVKNADQLELYDEISSALSSEKIRSIDAQVTIAADFARSIRSQVSGLERNLLEGLVVVLVVSFLLISLRASFVTALSMTTTLAITIGILELIGYSLNTITLFSLVLCLALIVDDTTIIVEAIDSGLRKKRAFRLVVSEALRKVLRASSTGTFTTVLAFAPMLFITGILGEFIRAIPVTIIISLLVSLAVSFIFIPLFMNFTYGRKNAMHKMSIIGRLETKVATFLAGRIIWSTQTKLRSLSTKLHAIVFAVVFVMLGGLTARTIEFNIFPSPKDGLEVLVSARPVERETSTIQKMEFLTDELMKDVVKTVGSGLEEITLLSRNGFATRDGFTAEVRLTEIGTRDVTSVEIATKLQQELQNRYPELVIQAEAAGVGPPEGGFEVQINSEQDPEAARQLANDVRAHLSNTVLTRVDGSNAKFVDIELTPSSIIKRTSEGKIISVSAGFDAKDVSTLVSLAENSVKEVFNSARLSTYGLPSNVLSFDFGQENENQDSFSSMGRAAGPLFIGMIVLMALLFRSIMQSILILSALPFAFFGVMVGLAVTNNAISFFTMLGVFALVGISVNNAILLTDYANQERDAGANTPHAIAQALRMRFRPLLTTSITSVLALLPLALNDPFWEGIAYTLIFGLLSSTLLVILLFPYLYLVEEGLRLRIRRKLRRA